ncbi:MAG: protein kinase [Alphaproteobacteria bacterium]|nr:protein kinase [Alphaproteobacteria bacterium]
MHVTPVHDDVAPPLADGRYRLIGVLGAGGMATVYKVWDSRLQVARAVKLLAPALARSPRTRERFESEARLMARLHHHNMVTVHDVGHDPGGAEGDRAWMVMELLTGGSLADRLLTDGPMAPSRACQVCHDVLLALQVAHDAGVVHRDIKPHNILLAGDGTPKITDFGIARANNRNISLTRTGAVMGTWAFMAPEIRSNAKQADVQSDLYAMGATLYMIATGRQPLDLQASNVRDHILGDLPPALRTVIERSTEYLPQDRYGSAREMAADLLPLVTTLADLPAPEVEPAPDFGPDSAPVPDHPTTLLGDSDLPPDSDDDESSAEAPADERGAAPLQPPPSPADGLLAVDEPSHTMVPPEGLAEPLPSASSLAPPPSRDTFLSADLDDELPAPTAGGRRMWVPALAALLLVGGVGGIWWNSRSTPGEEGAAPVEAPATVTAEGVRRKDPPLAGIAGEEAAAGEAAAGEAAAGDAAASEAPDATVPAEAAPAAVPRETAPAAAPRETAPREPAAPEPEPGLLRINSLPPAQVSIDGGPLRDTPIRDGVSLRPGTHRLRFVDAWGTERTTSVTIQAGKAQVVCWDIEADAACAR